jgi:ketosteroid isomerase-like protein
VAREEDEVLAANRAFYDAFESLDATVLARVWSESSPVSCIHPGWDVIEGRDAVIESWRRIARSTSEIKLMLDDVRVFVRGETAWVVLVERIDAKSGDERVSATAQATNVFLRERGAWKLVHHHAAPVRLAEEPQRLSQLN